MTATSREEGLELLRGLVEKYKAGLKDFSKPSYNETQARTDFVTPFLEALGWDVTNKASLPQSSREVFEEATVEVEDEPSSKRPDYELRFAKKRRFFVEAKKPSVSIETHKQSAFQVRRYAFSAGLPTSVLTNFASFSVYDATAIPAVDDEAHVARTLTLSYEQYEENFDLLWNVFSREAVTSGRFDSGYVELQDARKGESFDSLFLAQVRNWRQILAQDLLTNNAGIATETLNYVSQLYLSRIVFLRICEDREIQPADTLKSLDGDGSAQGLQGLMEEACAFYNSSLFDGDDESLASLSLSAAAVNTILGELYYPHSPYTFAVIETEILSHIYEEFLSERLVVDGEQVSIHVLENIREAGGVYPTPRPIVDEIVSKTITPLIDGSDGRDLNDVRAIDICCGSGIFLLALFEYFLEEYAARYMADIEASVRASYLFQVSDKEWRISFAERRRILVEHVFGVDIDLDAVEIAKLSLLLKLTEGENRASLEEYVKTSGEKALPNLSSNIKFGNSLVSPREWEGALGPIDDATFDDVQPFDFDDEFVGVMDGGGFDAVVMNPPYTRIQHLKKFTPRELTFFQSDGSPYVSLLKGNFDKYGVFIERGLQIAAPTGRIGSIVPYKFMTVKAGQALRSKLTEKPIVSHITYFGTERVFGSGIANYTCLIFLDGAGVSQTAFERVPSIGNWNEGHREVPVAISNDALSEATWPIGAGDIDDVVQKIRENAGDVLTKDKIFVGLQTSADDIYIFEATSESEKCVSFRHQGKNWEIEKSILKPCINDVPLHAYGHVVANRWMLFPYELFDKNGKLDYRLIQPAVLASTYPLAWAYLRDNEETLSRRSIQGRKADAQNFYPFGRGQSITKMSAPKIVLPVLSREPKYAYDTSGTMLTGGGNGPYYCIRGETEVENLFLLAVLNNPVSEAIIRLKPNVFGGGYYSHGKEYLEDLPIPAATDEQRTEVAKAVAELHSMMGVDTSAFSPREIAKRMRKLTLKRRSIESLIYSLHDLSEDEIAQILSVEPPPTGR